MKEAIKEIDYELPKLSKSKWILSLAATFFLSLFLYFPISDKINGMIQSTLAANASCALSYEDVSFEFFLPKIVVSNLNIPGRCMGRSAKDIFLKETKLNIRGLSFTPFGPHFLLETELFKNKIEAYFTVGMGTFALNLQEAKINLKNLKELIPMVKLDGNVTIDALVEFSSQGIEDLKAHIYSKDLIIPAQKVASFSFNSFNIQNLLLKAKKVGPNKIEVEELIIGNTNSPVRANFKGPIKLNNRNFGLSQLDLVGEIAFSKTFLENYSVVNLVMGKFNKKDDFYQIQLTGPLMRPNPTSPR